MQKKTDFSFAFPSASNFGEARVTKSREKSKIKAYFSFHFRFSVPQFAKGVANELMWALDGLIEEV